jgi:hypothetical protein
VSLTFSRSAASSNLRNSLSQVSKFRVTLKKKAVLASTFSSLFSDFIDLSDKAPFNVKVSVEPLLGEEGTEGTLGEEGTEVTLIGGVAEGTEGTLGGDGTKVTLAGDAAEGTEGGVGTEEASIESSLCSNVATGGFIIARVNADDVCFANTE